MYVLKASGEKEEFDHKKIIGTCLRAGTSKDLAEEIVREIKRGLYDGISTREILQRTLRLLKKKHPGAASRYDLKRAIMSLGPTGFPFEKFFAEILENYGYKTEVGKIMPGKCADHEVDIVAEKNSRKIMIECKYHNETGIYTGLKVAMYTYARFLDLGDTFDQAWLVCNTKLSYDAMKYANCQGLKMTCWGYPKEESLIRLVEDKKLYPITLLRTLKGYEKERLMSANLMLIKDFIEVDLTTLQEKTNLPRKNLEKIIREARHIFNG